MDLSESALPPYEPPRDDQIVVWLEDAGKPFIRGIYDHLFITTAQHATFQEFRRIVGEQAAETAVRFYRMEGPT